MNIIELARHVANVAHAAVGQKRKYTGDPYIIHPAAVTTLIECVHDVDDNMIAAAWLHDVVEDTHVDIQLIRDMFGADIADLVSDLTDVSKPEDGNRAERKAIDRAHTAQASARAKTIKLADLIDNTKDIVKNDPKFAKVYLAEKKLLLPHLKEGDAVLFKVASDLLEKHRSLFK